jgi:hypothetical protein
MAIALDGSAKAHTDAAATSIAATLTTSASNDVIVAIVFARDNATPAGNFPAVTMSGTGVTGWKLQFEFAVDNGYTAQVYWGVAASALAGVSITATFDRSMKERNIIVFGVSGANTTTPFDNHTSIFPGSMNTGSGFGNSTTCAAFSTACTNSLLVFLTALSTRDCPTSPTATYTTLQATTGSNTATCGACYKVVAATQSSITIGMGTIGGGSRTSMAFAIAEAAETLCTDKPFTPLLEGVNAAGQTTSQSTIAANLTTTHSAQLVMAIVARNSNVAVNSIAGTGTTGWTKYSSTFSQGSDDYVDIWYGVAASPLSAISITATFASAVANSALIVAGVVNGNTSAPFDANGSIPSTNGGSGFATVIGTGITTTETKGLGLLVTGQTVRAALIITSPNIIPFNIAGQLTGTGNNQSAGLYGHFFGSALSSQAYTTAQSNGAGTWLAIETALVNASAIADLELAASLDAGISMTATLGIINTGRQPIIIITT